MDYVYVVPMPGYVKEMVSYDDEGNGVIYINEIFEREQQLKAYDHAVRHLQSGHLDGDGQKADEIEAIAHKENEP